MRRPTLQCHAVSELIPVLQTLIADVDAGRSIAFCAVLATTGSTPQRPGAALLVREDFSTLGTLGGGCIEAEVQRAAFTLLRQGRSELRRFTLDHDTAWQDGQICGGQMQIAIMSIRPDAALEPYRDALARAHRRQPAWVPLIISDEGRALEYRLHLEVRPTLLIVGAGHIGQALAPLAQQLDFHVVVLDDRAEFAAPARFPPGVELFVADIARSLREYPLDAACYVVIVTRGHRHDGDALAAVIRRPAAYVGLIGSRRKSRLLLDDLLRGGAPREAVERVRTPIGLPIGAVTVPEIAVSIAAELVQVRRHTRQSLIEGPILSAVGRQPPEGVAS